MSSTTEQKSRCLIYFMFLFFGFSHRRSGLESTPAWYKMSNRYYNKGNDEGEVVLFYSIRSDKSIFFLLLLLIGTKSQVFRREFSQTCWWFMKKGSNRSCKALTSWSDNLQHRRRPDLFAVPLGVRKKGGEQPGVPAWLRGRLDWIRRLTAGPHLWRHGAKRPPVCPPLHQVSIWAWRKDGVSQRVSKWAKWGYW